MTTAASISVTVTGIALERETHLPILLLRSLGDDRVMPIPIGPAEASSIIIEMEKVLPPRPLTHDLIAEVFRRHGFNPRRLEIYGLLQERHLARLVYAKGLRNRTLEVRPSDGVALALRLNVPIVCDSSIFAAAATSISSYDDYSYESTEILYLS